jgi:hypothetical protein
MYFNILFIFQIGTKNFGCQAPSKDKTGILYLWKVQRTIERKFKLLVSGTIKRQKGHFVHMESTTNFIERESQKHIILKLPFYF